MANLDNEQMAEEVSYLTNYFRQRELTKTEAYCLMLHLVLCESLYASNKETFINVVSEAWDELYKLNKNKIINYKNMDNKNV